MQHFLRRLWSGKASPDQGAAGLRAVQAWAEAHGHRFARARRQAGFVVDAGALRIEWGPSQRSYIGASELRVRAELGPCADLQMLIATRPLVSALESEVFDQAVEGNRTRVDDRTPEEMRWLVLYPKLPRSELGVLAEAFGALSNYREASAMWLDAPLREQLAAASARHGVSQPLVLVVQRSRFVLRCPLGAPEVAPIEAALALAEAAASSAVRVGAQVVRGMVRASADSGGPASTCAPDRGG